MRYRARLRDGLWSIVLAAGGSSRLGQPKQLVRFGRLPLLLRAYDAAQATTPNRVVVVLGAQALRLRGLLRQRRSGAAIVTNGRWQQGMAGSLRRGLRRLPARCRAALIVLADQPGVDATALDALTARWAERPGLPAAAAYAGRVGVPAVLPRRLWREMRNDQADHGARGMLRDRGEISEIAMPEASLDIDTPQDLERLAALRSDSRAALSKRRRK